MHNKKNNKNIAPFWEKFTKHLNSKIFNIGLTSQLQLKFDTKKRCMCQKNIMVRKQVKFRKHEEPFHLEFSTTI